MSSEELDHLCLVIEPTDSYDGFDILEGPAPRSGAQGVATSVYVHDPDGLPVEFLKPVALSAMNR